MEEFLSHHILQKGGKGSKAKQAPSTWLSWVGNGEHEPGPVPYLQPLLTQPPAFLRGFIRQQNR